MGNMLRGGGLLSVVGGSNDAIHVQLGRHVNVALSKTCSERFNGNCLRARSMFYEVGDSVCELGLVRELDKYSQVKCLWLKLHCTGPSKRDKNPSLLFEFNLVVESETISTDPVLSPEAVINVGKSTRLTQKAKDVRCEDGSVIEGNTWLYGEGHKAGLVRVEKKKRSAEHTKYYAVTVIHYHATSAGIHVNETVEADFGLSVVANIEARHGRLSITVEGPEQHPSSALFYMFKEFEKRWIWNPNMCPHCEAKRILPRSIGGPSNNARLIKNY